MGLLRVTQIAQSRPKRLCKDMQFIKVFIPRPLFQKGGSPNPGAQGAPAGDPFFTISILRRGGVLGTHVREAGGGSKSGQSQDHVGNCTQLTRPMWRVRVRGQNLLLAGALVPQAGAYVTSIPRQGAQEKSRKWFFIQRQGCAW